MKHVLVFIGLLASWACLHSQTTTSAVIRESREEVVVRKLAAPAYPPLARAANITGSVELAVTLSSDGTPQSVALVTGHALLRQAALDSAAHSEFECAASSGATAEFRLTYDFTLIGDGDCCSALSVQPTVAQHHRMKRSVAKVAAARKLAVRLFWMLKTNTAYPEIARIEGSPRYGVVGES